MGKEFDIKALEVMEKSNPELHKVKPEHIKAMISQTEDLSGGKSMTTYLEGVIATVTALSPKEFLREIGQAHEEMHKNNEIVLNASEKSTNRVKKVAEEIGANIGKSWLQTVTEKDNDPSGPNKGGRSV